MKQKLKVNHKKKINKKRLAKLDVSFLAHPKHFILRHFRLIKCEHTGKLVHHRHTSHLLLVVILIFVGLFLYLSGYFASAESLAKIEGQPLSISVVATVPETASNSIGQDDKPVVNKMAPAWFEAPVPIYILALVLTLGFWLGDIFDRKFGISKNRKGSRRIS